MRGEHPVDLEEQLARFYDQEAPQRVARPLPERRVAARARFLEQLKREQRSSVIEIGSGAGHDAEAMAEARLRVTAVDLSLEHAAICRDRGVDAQVASLHHLPFADNAFDAGWTMSTLLHVPDTHLDQALLEILRVLRPGAPLAIGLWGGDAGEGVLDTDRFDPPRFFSIRTDDAVTTSLGRFGVLESFTTWPSTHDPDEHYQFAVLRI